MNRIANLAAAVVVVVLAFSVLTYADAAQQLINYQGFLTDDSDNPVPDGSYSVVFTIYDTASGGNTRWTETQSITTSNGLFTVLVGSVTPIGDTVLSSPSLYLGIKIEDDSEIMPRTMLLAIPWAFRATVADSATTIADDAVTSSKIQDGTIEFSDMGDNGALAGQVMKWNGGAWAASDDATTSDAEAWTRTGNIVNLATSSDSVGIGISTPGTKMEVNGDLSATGRGIFGSFHTISGLGSFVAGDLNSVAGTTSTISGGRNNTAIGTASTVGGGMYNNASGDYAVIAGGGGSPSDSNSASGDNSSIGGGKRNITSDEYAVISGGLENIASSGIATIGGGAFNLASDTGTTVAGGQANIASADGATVGGGFINRARGVYSVVAGGGGSVPSDSNSAVGNWSAIGGGAGNLAGSPYSVVSGGSRNKATSDYASVAGGSGNKATSSYASVAGGSGNQATSDYASVSGGSLNKATLDYASVSGGSGNIASGSYSTVGGGSANSAENSYATVSGGESNQATGEGSVISGGVKNVASGLFSVVVGGGTRDLNDPNTAAGDWSVVGGGKYNVAQDTATVVSGGSNNGALKAFSTIGGGDFNGAGGIGSTVSGGLSNAAAGDESTVAGGRDNHALGFSSVVGGGRSNFARGNFSVVAGGGGSDLADSNSALYDWSTVSGGIKNTAGGSFSTIGGGGENTALNWGSTVAGGFQNTSSSDFGTVAGGFANTASGYSSTVPGGQSNIASGDYSFAAGARAVATHNNSFVWGSRSSVLETFSSIRDYEFAIDAPVGLRSVANSATYGAMITNSGNGDGIRVYGNVSKGNLWGSIYGINTGSSPTLSIWAGSGQAGYFNGDVTVTGTLTKGGGAFKIDHPLDPEDKYLYHSFVESPDMMNVYNGNVVLDQNGHADISLPAYFDALNRDFRYQLTPIGGAAPNLHIAEKIRGNRFRIAGGNSGLEVSWQVTGIRKDAFADAHRVPVEESKPPDERGKYLHPDAFGQPPERGISYDESKDVAANGGQVNR